MNTCLAKIQMTKVYYYLTFTKPPKRKIFENYIRAWIFSYLTSREEGASLALVSQTSSESVTMKVPYGVDVLH